nr:MAG TPA: hypothetical protein [Caudoviricetes sp.]
MIKGLAGTLPVVTYCHHSRHDLRDDILMQFFGNLLTALCDLP